MTQDQTPREATADPGAIRTRAAAEIERSRSAPGLVEAVSAREADDRSMIAKWVMRGAGASVAAVYLFLILKAWATGDWNASAQVAVEILKSVILPVVTLVLGYYFGRSGRS